MTQGLGSGVPEREAVQGPTGRSWTRPPAAQNQQILEQNPEKKNWTKALQALLSWGICGVCRRRRYRCGGWNPPFLRVLRLRGQSPASSPYRAPEFGQRQGLLEQRNAWVRKTPTVRIRGDNQCRQVGREPITKNGLRLASRNRIRSGSENWQLVISIQAESPDSLRGEKVKLQRGGEPLPPLDTYLPAPQTSASGLRSPSPCSGTWDFALTLLRLPGGPCYSLPEPWPRGWVSQQFPKFLVSESVYGLRTGDLKDNTLYVGYICEHLPY